MASLNGVGLNGPHSAIANTSGDSLSGLGSKDEVLKNQFATREGVYRSMAGTEFRPNRVGYTTPTTNTPVKVSFVSMPDTLGLPTDRICFNVGRELFVYNYKGVKKATDHSKPVDKRIYKGTFPTCHDFSEASVTSDRVHLLIGFSAGQIQLIDPIKKEYNKLFNEERLIDKTKVTCIKWSPDSMNTFLVSHASGNIYVYKEELTCGTAPPHFQILKPGDGYAVYACKSKTPRNPPFRWVIGEGSLNEFSFSPCGKFLATVSQDGFLRVFDYESMDLVGRMRSYFGGLLCLSWSPDGRFIAAGGEDDLLTFWSTSQKRVVARGQGHKSWVSVVTFDPFTTSITDGEAADNLSDDEAISSPSIPCDGVSAVSNKRNSFPAGRQRNSVSAGCETPPVTSYRIGSVGQDTQLCLWELSDDVLKQPVGRSRTSILVHSPSVHVPSISGITSSGNHVVKSSPVSCSVGDVYSDSSNTATSAVTNNTTPAAAKSADAVSSKKDHKRNFSLGSRSSDKNSVNKLGHKLSDDPVKLLGQPCCPRLSDTPMLEPLICKKISHERLTSLVFRSDCFVTACQEGFVSTWARPGHGTNTQLLSSSGIVDENDHLDADDTTIV